MRLCASLTKKIPRSVWVLNATTRQTETEIRPTSGIRGFPHNFTSKLNFSVSAQTHLWSSRNGKCLIREMLSNLWQEDWKSGTNVYNATMSYKIQSNQVAVIGKLKLFVIPFETGSSKIWFASTDFWTEMFLSPVHNVNKKVLCSFLNSWCKYRFCWSTVIVATPYFSVIQPSLHVHRFTLLIAEFRNLL